MKIEYILIVIMLILTIISGILLGKYIIVNGGKEYYREQMISFCKIAIIQNKILQNYTELPVVYFTEDCNYWILDWDKEMGVK